jgi:hypothetical protein
MSKPSKEFINPKTLIAPAAAVYFSHIAKVNRGTIVYISGHVYERRVRQDHWRGRFRGTG